MIESLLHNPMITGGAALGATGGLLAMLRKVPDQLMKSLQRQIIITVDVRSNGRLFYWITEWLDKQDYSKRSRDLTAEVGWANDYENPHIVFSPAPGEHLLRFKGKVIWLTRNRRESDTLFGASSETLTLRFPGRSQRLMRDFFQDIEASTRSAEIGMTKVFMAQGDSWSEIIKKKPRPLDSVITVPGLKERLTADLQEFLDAKLWYVSVGLPYRRGYLLYGPPGNGKSSLTGALAGEFGLDLYIINLAAKDMDDDRLTQLTLSVPPKGLLLMEDIDSAFTERNKNDEHASHVTFSGLLNALDGVGAKDGQIVVMSTNHLDRLDPALIRPGRADLHLSLDNATESQAIELFQRFFPNANGTAKVFGNAAGSGVNSMATLQNHLLMNRDDEQAAAQFGTASL